MTAVTLIFPHQLFANYPCMVRGQDVYLIEETDITQGQHEIICPLVRSTQCKGKIY
jgi:hypothetical protein